MHGAVQMSRPKSRAWKALDYSPTHLPRVMHNDALLCNAMLRIALLRKASLCMHSYACLSIAFGRRMMGLRPIILLGYA